MYLLKLPDYVMEAMPPHYFGRWRITNQNIFDDSEGKKRLILRFKGDFYDTN